MQTVGRGCGENKQPSLSFLIHALKSQVTQKHLNGKIKQKKRESDKDGEKLAQAARRFWARNVFVAVCLVTRED